MKKALIIIFFLLSSPLWAYNFLYTNDTTGAPIGWEPGTTIHYYVDPGTLGMLTNEQARTLVQAAMDIWENASPYADVPHFEYAGLLPEDVNGANYSTYVSRDTCYTSDLESCPSQAQHDLKTVIIFDNDGTILSHELCRILSCGALGGARVLSGTSSNPQHIVQGIVVLGPGFALNSSVLNYNVGVIVHELGHMLGLAHPALNQQLFSSAPYSKYLPTMELESAAVARDINLNDSSSLNPDDIAGIITLYPATIAASNTGTIQGQITTANGHPMYYANIVARNIDDPFCEAFSFISGRSCAFNTDCSNPDTTPNAGYVISGLPPGTYTVEAEEIANQSLASVIAPSLFEPFIYGDAEFWNEGDQAIESNTLSSTITLTAGLTRSNVDIILNRNEPISDQIKYLPFSTYTSGPGTRCEPNTTNYATVLGLSNQEPSTPSNGGCSLLSN